MRVFDIFCDASVTNTLRGACAGALVAERFSQNSQMSAVIQPFGTNNSGEIAAILQGVMAAINVKNFLHGEECRFNIFSDSVISIKGVREWIFQWIYNANKANSNMLTTSSGDPVANQIYFKVIFNLIILNNISLYFYHQKGHVDNKFHLVSSQFQQTNGISLIRLGLTPEYISMFNNYVDNRTRDIIRQYFNNGNLSMSGISFDSIANTKYEEMARDMPIPVISVDPEDVTPSDGANFAMLNGKHIIAKYAELVHASEYPSSVKMSRYIS